MTFEQQEPHVGQCVLCADPKCALQPYMGEPCVCVKCQQTLHDLKALVAEDGNAEAREWIRRANAHITEERKINAPALVYARLHWAEMARTSQGLNEEDLREGEKFVEQIEDGTIKKRVPPNNESPSMRVLSCGLDLCPQCFFNDQEIGWLFCSDGGKPTCNKCDAEYEFDSKEPIALAKYREALEEAEKNTTDSQVRARLRELGNNLYDLWLQYEA